MDQLLPNESPQQNQNQPQNIAQNVLPEPEVIISNDVVPPVNNKISSKKKIIIFSILALILITILGVYIYFNFINKPKTVPITTSVEEKSQTKVNNQSNKNSIISYLVSTKDALNSKIVFYDTQTKEEIPSPFVPLEDNHSSYSLGKWSPSGRYLPVYVGIGLGTDNSTGKLYFYDSQKRDALKIYDSPLSSENIVWFAGTSLISAWLDDSRFVVNANMANDSQTLTYFNLNGEFLTQEQPFRSKKISNQLEYSQHLLSFSEYQKLENSNTNTFPRYELLKVGSNTLEFTPEGEIVGVVDGMLVTITQPKPSAFLLDTVGYATELEKLQKLGLSEEELSRKAQELMQPKGETLLRFYNIDNGNVEKTINLTEDPWYTQSILVHPSENFLVAYQTDNFMYGATKQRFIKINPSEIANIKIIFEENLQKGDEETRQSLSMYQGSNFFLTNEGDWIIGVRGSRAVNPENNKIYMKNINSGEEKVICAQYCESLAVYYPYLLQTKY